MTQKIYLVTIISLLLSIAFPSIAQKPAENLITFIQGDSSFKINKNTDSILLERKPFAIRYYGKRYDEKKEKFYAAQIAVLDNPNDTLSLKIGQSTKKISYYEPGTGMAPGENEKYDTIYITNSGHHYLTYENDNQKRVNLISTKNDLLELEWKITAANYNEKDLQFSELKLSSLYFVIFVDANLNEVIDRGELKIIKTIFK